MHAMQGNDFLSGAQIKENLINSSLKAVDLFKHSLYCDAYELGKALHVLRGVSRQLRQGSGAVTKNCEKALVKRFCEKNFTEFLLDLKKWSAFFYLPPRPR